jgi:hypothetical protein
LCGDSVVQGTDLGGEAVYLRIEVTILCNDRIEAGGECVEDLGDLSREALKGLGHEFEVGLGTSHG